MNKYTRNYYINDTKTSLDTILCYVKICLTHGTKQLSELNIRFEEVIDDA
jgi:hypothetical protein